MTYVDQAALAINAEFMSRVRMAMLDAATDIYSESTATTHHAQRGDLAVNVVRDPARWSAAFVELICADSTSLTTGSSDADIKTAISSVWNVIAGIVTT
jgi:hypothetical protein